MIADVEVTNPGFNEAMANLANLGRVIDRAIPRSSLASLGLPRIPAAVRFSGPSASELNPGSGALGLTDLGSEQSTNSQASRSSFPPLPAIKPVRPFPPLPGVKPLQGLDQTISNLTRPITDCCSELGGAVGEMKKAVASIETISKAIEACKCTSLPDEVRKRLDPITDGLRELPKPDYAIRRWIAAVIGGFVGTIVGRFLGPNVGTIVGSGVTGTVLGGFRLYDELNPDPFTMRERSQRELKGLEELSEPALHPGPDSNLDNYDSFLFRFFDTAWRTWNLSLEELIRNIESPKDDPEANALRYDSLEVLPDIIKDYEDAIELYRRLHDGKNPNIDRRILDKAIELRKQRGDAPGPTSRYESGAPGALDPASYGPSSLSASPPVSPPYPETSLEQLMQLVIARLKEPVRLEIRVLDDRVIARRLDGNRGVSVDFSRGPRMIGYIPV